MGDVKLTADQLLREEIGRLSSQLKKPLEVHLDGGGQGSPELFDLAEKVRLSGLSKDQARGQIGATKAALVLSGLAALMFISTLLVLRDHPKLAEILVAEGVIWSALIALASTIVKSRSDQARGEKLVEGIRSIAAIEGLSDEAKLAALKVLEQFAS